MKAADLFKIVEERGMTITVNDDGKPVLRGNVSASTPALIDALKAHRHEILSHLGLAIPTPPVGSTEQPVECLWPGNDFIGRHWFPDNGWPAGAYYYRRVGNQEWIEIPGRKWNSQSKCGTVEKKPERVDVESLPQP